MTQALVHRTRFLVEILSEGPLPVPEGGIDLPELDYLTSEGPCIGTISQLESGPIPAATVPDELKRFGNDGSFFDPVDA